MGHLNPWKIFCFSNFHVTLLPAYVVRREVMFLQVSVNGGRGLSLNTVLLYPRGGGTLDTVLCWVDTPWTGQVLSQDRGTKY